MFVAYDLLPCLSPAKTMGSEGFHVWSDWRYDVCVGAERVATLGLDEEEAACGTPANMIGLEGVHVRSKPCGAL